MSDDLDFHAGSLPSTKSPIWPLFVAPIAAFIYYGGLNGAFFGSLEYVVGDAQDVSAVLIPTTERSWSTHWIYRIVSEAISIGFGTFVAAGLARERAQAAGVIGGVTIAVLYAVLLGLILTFGIETGEPWYQNMITILIVPAAPLIGFFVGETAKEISTSAPTGFAGIPRFHFLWFWLLVYPYALGLIEPVARLLNTFDEFGMLVGAFVYIVRLIPVLMFSVPLYFGIRFLAGESVATWNPVVRQIVGVLILIVGLVIAIGLHLGIAYMTLN